MISPEKVKEVKKQLRSGVPGGEIISSLKSEGYSAEDIEQCFKGPKGDMRSWFLIFGFVFLIVGIWLFLKNQALLFLLFAAAMFYQYYRIQKKGHP